jgi:Tissue inhibitor of metalloproteinase
MNNDRFSTPLSQLLVMMFIGSAGLGLMAPLAQACKCAPEPLPVRRSLQSLTMVFRGKVLGVETVENGAMKFRRVKFVLKRSWKGSEQPYVAIATGMGNGDCGYQFIQGKEYLVYAKGTDRNLETQNCTRTKLWQGVTRRELRQLGKGKDIAWD